MSQKKSGSTPTNLGSKPKVDPGKAAKERKIVNVVADKVLIDSKKKQGKPSTLSNLKQKIFGQFKLPPALEKYKPRPLSYHFNSKTVYGRSNWSKATLGSIFLTILYIRHRIKSRRRIRAAQEGN